MIDFLFRLSEIDLNFLHEMDHTVKYKGLNDLYKLNTPEWARRIQLQKFLGPKHRRHRYTTIPPSHLGLNFSRDRLVEIPVSTMPSDSIKGDTVWNQSLFPVQRDKNSTGSGSGTSGRKTRFGGMSFKNEPCYSYESINEIVGSSVPRDRRHVLKPRKNPPKWNYKDLRTVFNNR